MNRITCKDRLVAMVRQALGGAPARITGSETLTADLGMGSLDLMSLFAVIEAELGSIDLLPWLVDSTLGGRDTIDGLCGYVTAALQANCEGARA